MALHVCTKGWMDEFSKPQRKKKAIHSLSSNTAVHVTPLTDVRIQRAVNDRPFVKLGTKMGDGLNLRVRKVFFFYLIKVLSRTTCCACRCSVAVVTIAVSSRLYTLPGILFRPGVDHGHGKAWRAPRRCEAALLKRRSYPTFQIPPKETKLNSLQRQAPSTDYNTTGCVCVCSRTGRRFSGRS